MARRKLIQRCDISVLFGLVPLLFLLWTDPYLVTVSTYPLLRPLSRAFVAICTLLFAFIGSFIQMRKASVSVLPSRAMRLSVGHLPRYLCWVWEACLLSMLVITINAFLFLFLKPTVTVTLFFAQLIPLFILHLINAHFRMPDCCVVFVPAYSLAFYTSLFDFYSL